LKWGNFNAAGVSANEDFQVGEVGQLCQVGNMFAVAKPQAATNSSDTFVICEFLGQSSTNAGFEADNDNPRFSPKRTRLLSKTSSHTSKTRARRGQSWEGDYGTVSQSDYGTVRARSGSADLGRPLEFGP
jgi:hypothetical protein